MILAIAGLGDIARASPDNSVRSPVAADLSADLGIEVFGLSDKASPGDVAVFEIQFENAGPADAADVVVSVAVPGASTFDRNRSTAGWSCGNGGVSGSSCSLRLGTVPAGATGQATFAIALNATMPALLDEIRLAGSIADEGPSADDADPDDNMAEATMSVDAAIDLRVAAATTGSTSPGGVIVYSLAFSNAGTRDAADVFLRESVPSGTTFLAAESDRWDCADGSPEGTECLLAVGAVAAGESRTARFAVRVSTTLAPATIENVAAISASSANGPDGQLGDNAIAVQTAVTNGTLLELEVSQMETTGTGLRPGETAYFRLDYFNRDGAAVDNLILSLTLPVGSRWEERGSTTGWSCSEDGACTLPIGRIEALSSGTALIGVRLDDRYSTFEPFQLAAAIGRAGSDSDVLPIENDAILLNVIVTPNQPIDTPAESKPDSTSIRTDKICAAIGLALFVLSGLGLVMVRNRLATAGQRAPTRPDYESDSLPCR